MEKYMEHEIEADTKGLGFSDGKDGAKDRWWKAEGLEVQSKPLLYIYLDNPFSSPAFLGPCCQVCWWGRAVRKCHGIGVATWRVRGLSK